MSLFMLELRLDPESLIRFAQDQGINRNRDEDLGYAMHTWLKSLLQDKAPKPFRLLQDKRRLPRVLGYTTFDGDTLLEQALSFASPLAASVASRIDELRHAKPLPAQWKEGRRLAFEALVCPISRKLGKEKDLFLHRSASWSEPEHRMSREAVYREWMEARLADAAELEQAELHQFRLVSQYRQGRREDGQRSSSRLVRPQALFRGVIRIRDTEEFDALLSRGIGRHRAFGYGMLLLRPT